MSIADATLAIPPPQFVELPGSRLAYRRWGAPDGQPIVFWHALGTATSGAYIAEVAATLVARHPVQVIAPDAPGFGASPALQVDAYGLDGMIDRFAALVEALQLAPPIVMGHSWGGVLAAFLAARIGRGGRGLVMLDSGHVDYQDTPGFDAGATYEQHLEAVRQPGRNFDPQPWEQFEAELRTEVRRWSRAIPAIVQAGVRMSDGLAHQIPTPEVSAAVRHALGQRRVSDAYRALAAADIPVLLLLATEPQEAGDLNRAAAPRFAEAVPQSETIFVENAGHDLFLDAGPRVAEAISGWLRRQVDGG